MPQSEYVYIRDEDWTELNRIFRRLNERVSQLEGSGRMSHKYSHTNMNGKRLVNGPTNQSRASDQEFITRDYLGSHETANIVSKSIGSGGLSPIILSPSQPGSETLGGPLTLPVDMIYGGGDGSTMKDFSISTGLWVPVYNPGGVNLDLTDGHCRVYSTSAVINTARLQQWFSGVRSKFSIYPDEDGIIEYTFKISNFSFNDLSSTYPGPNAVGSFMHQVTFMGISGRAGFGPCIASKYDAADANSVNYYRIGYAYKDGSSDSLIDIKLDPSRPSVAPNPVSGQFKVEISPVSSNLYKWPVVKMFWRLLDIDPWVDVSYATSPSVNFAISGISIYLNGIGVFLGAYTPMHGIFDSTISEFSITKGLAVIGQQSDVIFQ